MIEINNWSVCHHPRDAMLPPEARNQVLHGDVLEDGKAKKVLTSYIKAKRGECIVTSSGSHYKLGTIDPEYEKAYPNAKNRLWNTLPDLN